MVVVCYWFSAPFPQSWLPQQPPYKQSNCVTVKIAAREREHLDSLFRELFDFLGLVSFVCLPEHFFCGRLDPS